MSFPNSAASTLEEMAARLAEIENGASDFSQLPVVLHEASRLSFRVGPMSREDYDAWQNLKALESLQHESSGAAKSKAPLNRDKSDTFLLSNAVFSESGDKLSEGIVKGLLSGKGFGPSTHLLCEAAAAKNPPRKELTSEFQLIYGATRSLIVLVRILEKAGALETLRDRLAPGEDEAKTKAVADVKKWMATLPFWEAVLETEDAAKTIGVSVYEAHSLIGT